MKIKDNKSEIVNFRITETQKDNLELKAAEKGISVSAYLSMMLTDYENQKVISEQASRKDVEMMTKKEILEHSLQEARRDAQMINDTNFNNLYQSLYGKSVNGRSIRSKSDLLGVLALSVKSTVIENSADLEIPVEVKVPIQTLAEESNSKSGWIVGFIAIIVVTILGAIYYLRNLKDKRIQTNTNPNTRYPSPVYAFNSPKRSKKR
jgi:hypothetical protein